MRVITILVYNENTENTYLNSIWKHIAYLKLTWCKRTTHMKSAWTYLKNQSGNISHTWSQSGNISHIWSQHDVIIPHTWSQPEHIWRINLETYHILEVNLETYSILEVNMMQKRITQLKSTWTYLRSIWKHITYLKSIWKHITFLKSTTRTPKTWTEKMIQRKPKWVTN
jgi:hypothetical protein